MRTAGIWPALLVVAAILGFAVWQSNSLQLWADIPPAMPTPGEFVSPLTTPPAATTPIPTPLPQDDPALQYVAQRYGISLERLEIGQRHEREYPYLGRHFAAYTILEPGAARDFRLMVDLSDGSITEDIAEVERADAAARYSRYGKFDRPLYERLQAAGEQELLPVAIWVDGVRGRSEEELQQILAARHPEVREALARHAPLLDLSEPALVQRVKQEYEQLKREDIAARLQPVVAHLERRGVPFQSYGLLPSIAVTLTKSTLLTLVERSDVGTIYLVDQVTEPALDKAIPTDRVGPLWTGLGIEGVAEPPAESTIAIVEHGNVARNNTFLHHNAEFLRADNGDQAHTTWVASAAASFHNVYRGMAPGATILSAGEDGQPFYKNFALNWALDHPGVKIANLSECEYYNTPDLFWVDRAFDYTARTRHATITVAAGNDPSTYVCSPGRGWNVITVGGINDLNTADWSDDVMFYQSPTFGSSYRNPGTGDRQKPEVVAPADNISMLGPNNQVALASGTSLAAPQVAGLAALLIQRNAQLSELPTALKAILMASAIHNVEGASKLSDQDGAGSIDATLADRIAQTRGNDGGTCSGPCWWSIGTTSNYPAVGGMLTESISVSRGERVRVAIAWWSLADPPPAYPNPSNDVLATNFDLWVYTPSGNMAFSSVSWDNNYEMADFIATETGTYQIRVRKTSASESTNELGIAWVKDATYLPDLANNTSWRPWTSRIYVRNEGTQYQNADVTYFNAQGQFIVKDTCFLAPRQWCEIPVDEQNRVPFGQRASAIISGGEELSAQVVNVYASNPFAFDSYTGIRQGATTALHAPILHRNLSDLWSKMVVHNAGALDARIQVEYIARVGTGCLTSIFTVPRNGSIEFDLRHNMGCSTPPSQFQGAAQIRNLDARPLTGVVVDSKDVGQDGVLEHRRSYELIFDGRSPAYAPTIQRNYTGRNTGLYLKDGLDPLWWTYGIL